MADRRKQKREIIKHLAPEAPIPDEDGMVLVTDDESEEGNLQEEHEDAERTVQLFSDGWLSWISLVVEVCYN